MLITEDAVQKIYSTRPFLEVLFFTKTKYAKLIELYAKEFKEKIRAQKEQ